MENSKQELKNTDCHTAMRDLLVKLRDARPDERSELSRRYAVTITNLEEVLAYFWSYVVNNGACE